MSQLYMTSRPSMALHMPMCLLSLTIVQGETNSLMQDLEYLLNRPSLGDGLIVKNAKKAISSETLTQSLVLLQQYAKLPELITKIEGDKVSIVTCHQIISDFILELQSDDPIRTYLVNRLENMQDLMDIISCTTGLSPEKTAKLRGAVGSSASIERSFSKLGKLLAKDRNFNAKNVEAYICVYCNNL